MNLCSVFVCNATDLACWAFPDRGLLLAIRWVFLIVDRQQERGSFFASQAIEKVRADEVRDGLMLVWRRGR